MSQRKNIEKRVELALRPVWTALAALHHALDNSGPERHEEWNRKMADRADGISKLLDQYQRAKVRDHLAVEQYMKIEEEYQRALPEDQEIFLYDNAFHKDAPHQSYHRRRLEVRPNEYTHEYVPVRKKGFIDDEHSAEYHMGQALRGMLAEIAKKPLGKACRSYLLACVKDLVEAMDDAGIVLDQGKTYGNKTTMPYLDRRDGQMHVSHARGRVNLMEHIDRLLQEGHER